MTKEPIDATARILREIQATLAEHARSLADHGRTLADHGQTLANHSHRFDGLERLLQEIASRLGEVRSGTITTLVLAANADVRQEDARRDIEDLRRGIEVLEEKA